MVQHLSAFARVATLCSERALLATDWQAILSLLSALLTSWWTARHLLRIRQIPATNFIPETGYSDNFVIFLILRRKIKGQ
jgi:hypothetical protein